MNEKLQYAEMLEIPVNTCNITYQPTKKRINKGKNFLEEIKEKLAKNNLSFEGEYQLFSFDTPSLDCEKSVIVSKCFG